MITDHICILCTYLGSFACTRVIANMYTHANTSISIQCLAPVSFVATGGILANVHHSQTSN